MRFSENPFGLLADPQRVKRALVGSQQPRSAPQLSDILTQTYTLPQHSDKDFQKGALSELSRQIMAEVTPKVPLPLQATAAWIALKEGLYELLKNSHDAHATAITLSITQPSHQKLQIMVSDNGAIPIPPCLQGRYSVALALSSASEKTRESLGGACLGLALMTYFVEAFGQGALMLEPLKGQQGAVVRFYSSTQSAAETVLIRENANMAHVMIWWLYERKCKALRGEKALQACAAWRDALLQRFHHQGCEMTTQAVLSREASVTPALSLMGSPLLERRKNSGMQLRCLNSLENTPQSTYGDSEAPVSPCDLGPAMAWKKT